MLGMKLSGELSFITAYTCQWVLIDERTYPIRAINQVKATGNAKSAYCDLSLTRPQTDGNVFAPLNIMLSMVTPAKITISVEQTWATLEPTLYTVLVK